MAYSLERIHSRLCLGDNLRLTSLGRYMPISSRECNQSSIKSSLFQNLSANKVNSAAVLHQHDKQICPKFMQPLRPPEASMSMLIRMNCYSDKRLDDDKTKLRIKLGTKMLPERKIKRFDDKANHNSQYVILLVA